VRTAEGAEVKSFVFLAFLIIVYSGVYAVDLRQYQHGVNVLERADGKIIVIWSSSGNPPEGEDENGNWTHDVYYALVNRKNPHISDMQTLITYPEAQEPASAAMADNGNIIITMEDGWNSETVAQRFGVYSDSLTDIRPYPRLVYEGGHSGHAAAIGNYFVVFYNEGWIDGGGVDELGTGIDVYAKIYDSLGVFYRFHAFDKDSTTREGWPLPAASKDHICFLWQQGYNDKNYTDIFIQIYDPFSDEIIKGKFLLESGLKYYTHDVQYIDSLDAFLITGSYQRGGGFAVLLDNQGEVLCRNTELSAFIREAQAVIYNKKNEAIVVRPTEKSSLQVLNIKRNDIVLKQKIETGYLWQYMGADGLFVNRDSVYIVNLNKRGLVEKIIADIDRPNAINEKAEEPTAPYILKLFSNYPNPFNSSTIIKYELTKEQNISIAILDIKGRKISNLFAGEISAGVHNITWDAHSLASGLYIVRIKWKSGIAVKKILLLK